MIHVFSFEIKCHIDIYFDIHILLRVVKVKKNVKKGCNCKKIELLEKGNIDIKSKAVS